MSVVRDAINALVLVLNDPDLSLEFQDRETLLDATGLLHEYEDEWSVSEAALRLPTARMPSTVLGHTNGTQRSFQASMKVLIASVTWRTEVNDARRMACR